MHRGITLFRALKSHAFGVRHTQFNPCTRSHATLRISHSSYFLPPPPADKISAADIISP